MITAIDTSVLVDVFAADVRFGPASKEMLRSCLSEGRVVACDVVWAEVAGLFPSATLVEQAMGRIGVEFSPLGLSAALAAGAAWRTYRSRGGKRQRVVAHFLVGAHAAASADRLLTRDRGFYRSYFNSVQVLDPSSV